MNNKPMRDHKSPRVKSGRIILGKKDGVSYYYRDNRGRPIFMRKIIGGKFRGLTKVFSVVTGRAAIIFGGYYE